MKRQNKAKQATPISGFVEFRGAFIRDLLSHRTRRFVAPGSPVL